MATNFPTSLDNLDPSRGTANQPLSNPSHVTHHQNEDDAIEALQAKVGVDGSAVTTSLDYQINDIVNRFEDPLEVSPGHKHVAADISDLLPISSSTGVADAGKLVKTNHLGLLDRSFLTGTVSIDTYTSNNTWNKPSEAKFVLIECMGAGGSGGALVDGATAAVAGGGGGEYRAMMLPASLLTSTVAITIGTGGVARVTAGAGSTGATGTDTSFGAYCIAKGGTGGSTTPNDATATTGGTGGTGGTSAFFNINENGGNGGAGTTVGNGSAGGGASTTLSGAGGGSAYVDIASGSSSGGTSTYGSAGGAGAFGANATATSGTNGGGGGGALASSGTATSGAGGNGFVRITSFK